MEMSPKERYPVQREAIAFGRMQAGKGLFARDAETWIAMDVA